MQNKPDYIEILPSKLSVDSPTVKYKNRFIHSSYNPIRQAETDILKFKNLSSSKFIIILGVGYGYILDAVYKKISESAKVLVIEKEEYFKNFLAKKYSNFDNFYFFWNAKADTVKEFLLNNSDGFDIESSIIIENNVLTEIDSDYYTEIKKAIKDFFRHKTADITTTAYFSDIWLRNIILNIRNLNKVEFISNYKKRFAEDTVLFISASPFVKEHIDFIKSFKGMIFALAPAAGFLVNNGINPDFVISTDAGYYNMFHLDKYRHLNIITELSVHPAVLDNRNGKVILIDFNLPPTSVIKDAFGEIGYIPQGGTVAVTSMFIFEYLNVKNIISIGQDFMYYGFYTHISDSGYDKYFLLSNNKYETFLKKNFMQIYNNRLSYMNNYRTTDSKLLMYKDWFYKVIKNLKINIISPEDFKLRVTKKDVSPGKQIFDFNILEKKLKYVYDKIKKIDIKKYNSFREVIDFLQKDIFLYNLFSMIMYIDFMKYSKGNNTDDRIFFENFERSRINLLKLFEAGISYINDF